MTTYVTALDPDFEVYILEWLGEWEVWCNEQKKLYEGKAFIPSHIERQQQRFGIWLSIQKDIIVLDMHR